MAKINLQEENKMEKLTRVMYAVVLLLLFTGHTNLAFVLVICTFALWCLGFINYIKVTELKEQGWCLFNK